MADNYSDSRGGGSGNRAQMYDNQGEVIGLGPAAYPGESYNGRGQAAINWLRGLGWLVIGLSEQ